MWRAYSCCSSVCSAKANGTGWLQRHKAHACFDLFLLFACPCTVFLAHIEGSACFQLIQRDPRLHTTNSARLAAFQKVKDKLAPWEVLAYLHNLITTYLDHDVVDPPLSIQVPMIDSYPWLTTLRGGNLAKLVQTQGKQGQGKGQGKQGQGKGDIPTSQASSMASSSSSASDSAAIQTRHVVQRHVQLFAGCRLPHTRRAPPLLRPPRGMLTSRPCAKLVHLR